MKRISLLLMLLPGFLFGILLQAQICIPSDYPTIQQGIAAANPGDTVLVSDGVYYEQVNFLGKAITVASNYIMDADPAHIANTILDGDSLEIYNSTVVLFISGEDTTSVISGFTIRNGKGTSSGNNLNAGGIKVQNSGAKIMNNRITHNILDGTQPINLSPGGAGISTPYSSTDNWVVILNNTIDSNQCISNQYDAAAAAILSCYNTRMVNNIITNNSVITSGLARSFANIFIESRSIPPNHTLIAENNIVQDNSAISDNNEVWGAGFLCVQLRATFKGNDISYNTTSTVHTGFGGAAIHINLPVSTTITGNIISDNFSSGNGGALYMMEDLGCEASIIEDNIFTANIAVKGGAIYAANSDLQLKNNLFEFNCGFVEGGALYLYGNNDEEISTIENNTFISNQSAKGGAINAWSTNLLFINNLFHQNNANADVGGAICLFEFFYGGVREADFINNTFSGNKAYSKGGAIYATRIKQAYVNNIFWEDSAPAGGEIFLDQGIGSISYSDIDTNKIEGNMQILEGVICQNPTFCENYCLMPSFSSPCLDAGTSQYILPGGQDTLTAPAFDIMGHPRPTDNGYDMGAYEVHIVGITEEEPEIYFSIYPNPFTGTIYCQYRLDKESDVSMTLYDISGRMEATWHKVQGAGIYNVPLNLEGLQRGLYLMEIKMNDQLIVKKILKH